MLSLLGSLLGFGTSIIPDIMGFFKEKQANKHELSMMDKVTDREVKVQNVKLQMTEITADSGEANAARQTFDTLCFCSSCYHLRFLC